MRAPLRRAPRLLVVAVLAFAQFERFPMLGAAQLFRGLAIQFGYRLATGHVVAAADDKAVLLWSEDTIPRRPLPALRELGGLLFSVLVGLVLFMASNLLLLIPLRLTLRAAGVPLMTRATISLGIVVLRMVLTVWRAVVAYRVDQRRMRALPRATRARWRVDYLAAGPLGEGHGGRLLETFLAQADGRDAEVVLVCDERNKSFYRRHGFHVVESDDKILAGHFVMRRRSRTERTRPGLAAPAVRHRARRIAGFASSQR